MEDSVSDKGENMATLKINYTDDVLNVSQNKLRKYQILNNDDGTISLIDVTDYTSVGSELTSTDINAITKQINSNTDKIGEADISAVGDGTTTGAISALNESLTAKADKNGTEHITVTKDVPLDGYSFANAPFVAETTLNAQTPAGYGFHNAGSIGMFLYMNRADADLRVHYNDNSDFALITERNNPAGAVLTAKWNGDVFSFTGETKTNIITLELPEGTWFVCGYSLVKMGDLWVNIPNASYEPTFARNGSGNGEMTLYSFGITQGGKAVGLCIQGNATIYPDIHFCGLLAYRIK